MERVQYQINGMSFGEEEVIHFAGGIPGFENLRKFVIAQVPNQEPFMWLHSIEEPHIRFVIINPLVFDENYSPKISKEQIFELEVKNQEDLLLFVIVTIKKNLNESTANLAGPVLVNIREKKGKQIILDDQKYSVHTPFLQKGGL